MATIADSAVGAILEIPPATLTKIAAAERAIQALGKTSWSTANSVKTHWGVTAVEGLNKFIQALKNAQGEIANFKTNDININIKPAEQKLNDVSNSAKKTAKDVSNAVVKLAQSDINFTNFVELDKVVSKFGLTYQSLAKDVKDFETQRKGMQVNDPETQEINKKIEALKEYLRVKKQSETRQQYSTTTVDRDILSEQKRLLQDQINLQKQLNEQKIKVKSGGITENANLEKEKKDLEDLRNKYIENGKALKTLAQEKKNLSDAGSRQFELNAEKQTNLLLEQQRRYRQDLNKELNKTRELTSATQVSKATISSRDESQIQRQLNNDYSAMIRIIREVGKVKADAAKEGRATNQQENALIQTLWERYRGFAKEVLSIQNNYAALGRARAEAFRNDRSEQLVRNAVMLAEAQVKATQAAQKNSIALHDIASVESKIQNVTNALKREETELAEVDAKIKKAHADFDAFNKLNPNFNIDALDKNIERIKSRIRDLWSSVNEGLSPKREGIAVKEIRDLEVQLKSLEEKSSNYKNILGAVNDVQANGSFVISTYKDSISSLNLELTHLQKELERVRNANAVINAENAKGSTVKNLTSEYKSLMATIQRLGEQMHAFRAAGGDTNSVSYRTMMSELQKLVAREKEIRMMSINEVEAYRSERAKAAYQADLSAFVQNEAQKTATAKQAAQEQAEAQKRTLQQYLQTAQGAMWQARQVTSGKGTGDLATNLENIKRAINDIKAASGKLNLLDPKEAHKAEQLKKKIAELETLLKKYKAAATPDKPVISPQDAINAAKNARSLKQLQDAYKNLKTVMSTTDPKSDIWRQMNTVLGQTKTQIDNIRTKMGELQSQSKRTGDVLSQLKGQFGAIFSVAAIQGYIKKMVDVRAQFELQNVALRAILQNKDEADRIFMQVQQMALQSPFTIMQLTTYTKQLAAYRIESDKLVGTTKMLADVSAGLGVDIARLILAYGQVKSANYLRATEVRQFTEAGLNIAGELANYFSELQGKMISVGDVMEMITKRMVRFEDIEEVFKRVTSAGGLFYDMQKKQAETLSGQLQRITDAYNIMLNEIGKSNQSNISKALTAIRSLISHWRFFVPILTEAGYLMAGVIAAKGLAATVKMVTKLGTATATFVKMLRTGTIAAKALNMAFSTTGIGALITLTVAAIAVFQGLNEEANALNEHLSSIGQESLSDMTASIDKFKELANTIRDTNATFKERNEAYEEMVRTYSDILPAYALERDYIQNLGKDYSNLTDEIKKYYQKRELEKKIETTKSESKDYEKMQEHLKGLAERMFKTGWFDDTVTQGMAEGLMQRLGEEIASGETEATIEAATTWIKDKFGEHLKQVGNVTDWWGKDFRQGSLEEMLGEAYGLDDLSDAIDRAVKYRESIDGLAYSLSTAESIDEQMSAARQIRAQEIISKAEEESKAITGVVSSYYELQKKIENLKSVENPTDAQKDSLKDLENALKDARTEILQYSKDFKLGISESTLEGIKDIGDLNNLLEVIKSKAMPQFAAAGVNALGLITRETKPLLAAVNEILDKLNMAKVRFKKDETQQDYMTNYVETADYQKTRAELIKQQKETEWKSQQDLNDKIIKEESQRYKVSSKLFDTFRIEQGRSATEYAKDLIGKAEEIEGKINNLRAARNKGILKDYEKTSGMSYTNIEQYEREAKALRAVATKYQPYDKKADTKAAKDALKDFKENIKNQQKALEDFYKRYQELRKDFSIGESERQDISAFEELFKKVNLNMADVIKEGFDTDGFIKNLEKLKATVPPALKDVIFDIQKSISDNSVKLKVELAEKQRETLQKDIDNLFANMELTKTFADLGLNVDLTYIVGGKPTTLADVRKQLESMSADMASKSLEEQKIYQKALETLRKKEHDNQIARIKNYNKYLLESMSERVQIELKAMQEINKIRNDETLDQFSKDQAVINRRKKMQEDLTKFDFDQFKGSDVYIDTFKDLEKASKEQLQYVIDKLKELQSVNKDLSPVQVKSIANEIRKAQDALGDKTSFVDIGKNLKESIDYAKNRNQLLKEQVALQQNIDSQNKNLSSAEKVLYDLTLQRDSIQDKNTEEWKAANIEVERQQSFVKSLTNLIQRLIDKQKDVTDEISEGEQAWINFKGGLGKVNEAIGKIKDSTDAIFAGLDSMGLVSDSFRDTYESISDIIGGVQTAMEGLASIDITKPFSVITGLGKTIGGIFSSIGGIFGMGDKKKERQIKRLQERVKDLDKAYQKLEKSIEAAYTFDQYNAGYKQMQQNLESQKAAYEEMIRLEEAKKKTDKDKVKEYQDKLDELAEAEKELHDQRIEAMGSTTDYMSEAESFVSAWLDAYKETGDGLDALKESWDEFIENLFIKQAAAQIVSTKLKSVIDIINSAIDKGATDFELADAVNEARSKWEEYAAKMVPALEELFGSYGLGGTAGEFVLSDLQKGIQNITEPQAAAIEAYLNSMRFAVFRHTEQLDTLIASVQAQYGSGAENPIVTELKGIRTVLDSIDRRLGSVIDNRVGRGAAIRVAG